MGRDGFWDNPEAAAKVVSKLKGLKARYVRFYSNGSTADDLNRYTEVEVYGK